MAQSSQSLPNRELPWMQDAASDAPVQPCRQGWLNLR